MARKEDGTTLGHEKPRHWKIISGGARPARHGPRVVNTAANVKFTPSALTDGQAGSPDPVIGAAKPLKATEPRTPRCVEGRHWPISEWPQSKIE
jgi:hypothetical protein